MAALLVGALFIALVFCLSMGCFGALFSARVGAHYHRHGFLLGCVILGCYSYAVVQAWALLCQLRLLEKRDHITHLRRHGAGQRF